MKHWRFFIANVLVVSGIVTSMALANPSCVDWIKQENGKLWRICVGDDGKNFCQELETKPGSVAVTVDCKK
jgi:hypothetical protein